METDEEMQETIIDGRSDVWSDEDISDSERKLIYSDDDSEDELITYNRAGRVVFYNFAELDAESSECDDTDSSDTDFNETDDGWTEDDIDFRIESFEGESGLKIFPTSNRIESIVALFMGDDFFELLCKQSNLYYKQNAEQFKNCEGMDGFTEISCEEMRKFLGLLLMMGVIRKMYLKEFWSTDELIKTPYFIESMDEQRFFQIWRVWHFNDNELNQDKQDRQYKIEPILTYFLNKFNAIYSPKQNLTLKDGFIPWKGTLFARAECSRTDLKPYGIPVKVLSESDTGYILNVHICWTDADNTEKAIMTILDPYLGVWHHVYQNTYYNSTRVAEYLLQKKTRTCGRILYKRALPESFKNKASAIKRRQNLFIRKENTLLCAWKGNTLMYIMSTIHKSNTAIIGLDKKGCNVFWPKCAVEYNKNIKDVDRLGNHLSWGGAAFDTKKWTKKMVLFLINCAVINSYNVYKIVSTKRKKLSFRNFVIQVATKWIEGKDDRNHTM